MTQQINFRPYQLDIINRFDSLVKSGERDGLLILATGGGKTLVAMECIKRHFLDEGKKVLWVAHRKELLNQAINTLEKISPKTIYSCFNSFEKDTSGQIVFMSIQSSDGNDLKEVDCLVIDETHHECSSIYRSLLNKITYHFKFGLTACPIRLDSQIINYTNVIHNISIAKLIELGFAPEINLNIIDIGNTTIKDKSIVFIEDEVTLDLDNNKLNIYLDYIKCINIITKEKIDREEILTSNPDVIINKEIFIEGFDWPECENVYIYTYTNSLNQLAQMIGRAMRLSPGANNISSSKKKVANIYIDKSCFHSKLLENCLSILHGSINFNKNKEISKFLQNKDKKEVISKIQTKGKTKIIEEYDFLLLSNNNDKFEIICPILIEHYITLKNSIEKIIKNIINTLINTNDYLILSIIENIYSISIFDIFNIKQAFLNKKLYFLNKLDSYKPIFIDESLENKYIEAEIKSYLQFLPDYKSIAENAIDMLNDFVFKKEKKELKFIKQDLYGKSWKFSYNPPIYKNPYIEKQQYYKLKTSLTKKLKLLTNRKYIEISLERETNFITTNSSIIL